MPTKFAGVTAAFALLFGAGAVSANEGGHAGWEREADNEVGNLPSLQRGARNFMAYCSGCHSLQLRALFAPRGGSEDYRGRSAISYLVRPGDKATDYIHTSMPDNGRDGVVRQGAARPVAGDAFARQRLGVQFPDDLLRRSGQPPDRREQPAVAGHGDAARARQRAGRAERRVAQCRARGRKTANR